MSILNDRSENCAVGLSRRYYKDTNFARLSLESDNTNLYKPNHFPQSWSG